MTEFALRSLADSRSTPRASASSTHMAESPNSQGWRRVGRHYILLLWKNLILAKRTPVRTFLEITLPVFFGFLLLLIRYLVTSKAEDAVLYPAFSVDELPPFSGLTVSMIGYAPNTTFAKAVMTRVASRLNLYAEPYPDEQSLVTDVNKLMPVSIFLGGVVFTNLLLDSNITYKIRLAAQLRNSGAGGALTGENTWRTNLLYPVFPIIGPRNPKNASGGSPGYYSEGFLALQRALDIEIINQLNSSFNASNYDMKLQRFPFPSYKADNFVLVIQFWLPFLLVMSYIFAAINAVKNIVYEKEKGLKVAMSIMGLSGWIHWLSWFTRTLVFLLIADILLSVCYIIKIPIREGPASSVIGQSNIGLVFFFLFTYSIASICFMFLLSTLFDKANSAAAGTGGLWFLSYLPYLFIQPRYETMTRGAKMGSCFLHNIGLSLGAQLIGIFEGKGTGLQWSMFNQPASVDDNLSMADVVLMLYIDSVIYLVLALYIENIWPGEYGIPKSVFYPFQLSYWRGHTGTTVLPTVDDENDESASNPNAFEQAPIDKELGIQLKHVGKTYRFFLNSRPPVNAVTNLSMNIYSGQLTALLGHNGAGKSTTISMITGLIPPSQGQIIVNGYDVATSMDKIRNILGLCPQYNILFDQLTVREHLRLFATLKGHPSDDIDNEITKMVTDLRLNDKLDTVSSSLSGGMKRKLSVGIALIANSKVVILDEPTSGMDPAARRSTWDMLQRFRLDRTIVFTTHFMDEADVLGDRIAIMGNGFVRCCGSPFFLKTNYGAGYHLILSKDTDTDPQYILQAIQKHVPEAKMESAISAECKILLPHTSSPKFPVMFQDLESRKEALHIFGIGLSETSIEEVFMKTVEEDEPDEVVTTTHHRINNSYDHDQENGNPQSDTYLPVENPTSLFEMVVHKNSGPTLVFQQFSALLLKHILNSMRNYLVLFASFLPVLFVIISLIIEQQIPKPGDSPAMFISLDRYPITKVPFAYDPAETSAVDFIRAYGEGLETSGKPPTLVDLTTNGTDPCPHDQPANITVYLICIGQQSIVEYSERHLIGAEVAENGTVEVLNLIGLFNNQPYHGPPLTLNHLTNGLLKQYSAGSLKNRTINVINHPLPRSLRDVVNDFQAEQLFGYRLASGIVFGFGFMMASFAVFLIKERVSKAKHLQFLSGTGGMNFWLSTFVWDLCHFIVCSILIFIIWTIFYYGTGLKKDLAYFLTAPRLGYSVLLFFCFAFSKIPMTYLMSYMFDIPASGFAWITIINIITSQATLLAIVILSIPQLDLLNIARTLEWIFLIIFPNYCFGQGLTDIYKNAIANQYCALLAPFCVEAPNPCCKDTCGKNCLDYTTSYLAWESPGIGRFVTFMIIQAIVFFGILLCIDYRIFARVKFFIRSCCRPSRSSSSIAALSFENTVGAYASSNTLTALVPNAAPISNGHANDEDDDVKAEVERIQRTSHHQLMSTDVLVLNQVSKVYGGVFRAVDQISFGVPRGECFGLLGVNGAGKTSTFKMITGDESIDDGSIFIDSMDLRESMTTAQRRMGYCPQFDALIDLLTGEETLFMFARLHGVQEYLIPQIVNPLIDLMNLRKHARKPVYAYSGGNKRKLSAAVALIGDPAIIFLDEPTTGMDPKARRHFWNAIAQFRDHGKPIILTSHSMEECEALCTRLAIMVNGKLKCLGNIQHLKSKFGAGYTLKAKLNIFNDTLINELFSTIKRDFHSCELKEAYEGYVHIHVNENNLSLGALFSTMESCKEKYHIENYTVSQTTLEEVFLTFAESQLDPDELRRRMRAGITMTQRCARCCC